MLSEQEYGSNLADCWFNQIRNTKPTPFRVCNGELIGSLARDAFLGRLKELFDQETEEYHRTHDSGPRSESLDRKINKRLNNEIMESADLLLSIATSSRAFSDQRHLRHHLVEGAQLRVNKLASQNLSIPNGKYIVWANDAKHTTLVPIDSETKYREVFEGHEDKYDLFTSDLLKNWNYLEKVLAEDDSEDDDDDVSSAIDMSTVDRDPIVRSMEQQGHTVTSLAKACGVLPPAISRVLRIPKRTKGDPGGRNPSIGLAAQIANELKMNPEALFPDIFGTMRRDLKPRKPPANSGSGMKQAAKGSTKKGGSKK